MKIRFKSQEYQTAAVESVVDCFEGQASNSGVVYRVDPGAARQSRMQEDGFRNADISLSQQQILANVQAVQKRQNLTMSDRLDGYVDDRGRQKPNSYSAGAKYNFDIEMETGTGKTYCYIKTMFEMNKRYGWSKFIIMVPSIAIREGAAKSLEMTAEHFTESYGKKVRFFTYNSMRLHELESFSSDAGINVMVINVQAFNASGADNRRIYEELDDFQSRKPIDVIAKNRPIIILDEPQKMEGPATQKALPKFNPLMILRYSATHKTQHNKVHRLDAVDAFSQKLVKKIEVRGIQAKGLTGTNAYLYLENIEISSRAPVARVELEIKTTSGIVRKLRRLEKGRDLHDMSGGLDQYRGFVVADIDARVDEVHFTNGAVIEAGQATQDITEDHMRRLQIRETIRAHLKKEQQLHSQGIKVLSLFFIDQVSKYRDYDQADQNGEYAKVFEEEYIDLKDELLSELPLENEDYRKYLEAIDQTKTHNGYFAIDKKGQMVDPKAKSRGEDAGLSDDISAYDLILKDKERLLSFAEPTRFIFSHSALREGWDNPNVFVICMLKHSDNTISRRQEVGRGLRISVDQLGERMDNPVTVHDINVLTVVASESYKDFVAGLQKEIVENLSARPRQANAEYFEGKLLNVDGDKLEITKEMAKKLERFLIQKDYVDLDGNMTEAYHTARKADELAELPEGLQQIADQLFGLVDTVFNGAQIAGMVSNGRKPKRNPLNENFHKKEFQELWSRINRKAVYQVDFESDDLIAKCVSKIDSSLRVTALQYIITGGQLVDDVTGESLEAGTAFVQSDIRTDEVASANSGVTYDLIGRVSEGVDLTRSTVGRILSSLQPSVFDQFKKNPEQFIAEAIHIIKEQKATLTIERLTYDAVTGTYGADIFTAAEAGNDFSQAVGKLNKHVFDYAICEGGVEKKFIEDLDTSPDVVVYSKLPRGFLIPTPVGDYNPDWAIAFTSGSVKHLYFVAETKSSQPSMKFRELEAKKIECARKFFAEVGRRINEDQVVYDVVEDFSRLMAVVSKVA
ncbi:DEAD/DEAH box helicase family protein [Paracoccaceae bacterium]|nr:DEAD/DEAH box helicase family protein [Paracoccaceae bacterium]